MKFSGSFIIVLIITLSQLGCASVKLSNTHFGYEDTLREYAVLNLKIKSAGIDKDESLYLCFDNADITIRDGQIFFLANKSLNNERLIKSGKDDVSIIIPRSYFTNQREKGRWEWIYTPPDLLEKGCDFKDTPIPISNIEFRDDNKARPEDLIKLFKDNAEKLYSIFNVQENKISTLKGVTQLSYFDKQGKLIHGPEEGFVIYVRSIRDNTTSNVDKMIGVLLFPFAIITDIVTFPVQAIFLLMMSGSAH